MESATQLIVHTTQRHFAEGEQDHIERLLISSFEEVSQQKIVDAGTRKFRRAAKPAMFRIEHAAKSVKGSLQNFFTRRGGTARVRHFCIFAELLKHLNAGLFHALPILPPGASQILENRSKSRTAIAIVRREIGAAKEWPPFRREKYRHRPSASAGRSLHEKHIDSIDVRPLLAVHFHRDEIFIQNLGDFLIFERLALHDVAPVAGGVSDGKKDGFVFARRFGEGLVAPRVPIHGIVRVLQKIGALFLSETIGVHRKLDCSGLVWLYYSSR